MASTSTFTPEAAFEQLASDGRATPYRTTLLAALDDWEARETELLDAGVAVPADWRAAWLRRHARDSRFLVALDRVSGRCSGAAVLDMTPTRAMPGHLVARVERFGVARHVSMLPALVDGLVAFATSTPRLLRLEVAPFSLQPSALDRVGRLLASAGFVASREPRMYTTTSIVDLTGTEDDILARFHPTARRHIRASKQNPDIEVRPIASAAWVPAMTRLVKETRGRTGGGRGERPWAARIALATEQPGLAAVLGLYRKETDELLAFACGHHHGASAVYADAASTRPSDLKIPLGYALAWELMLWAKKNGATCFDFGGITRGCRRDGVDEPADADPLAGISDFKRYFRGAEQRVSEEWMLEPHPVRAFVAGVVSRGAHWAREHRGMVRRPARTARALLGLPS